MTPKENGFEIGFETKANVITFCYNNKQDLEKDLKNNYFNIDGKTQREILSFLS